MTELAFLDGLPLDGQARFVSFATLDGHYNRFLNGSSRSALRLAETGGDNSNLTAIDPLGE